MVWSAATSISSRLRLGIEQIVSCWIGVPSRSFTSRSIEEHTDADKKRTLYRLRIRAGCRQNGKGTREHGPVRGGSKGHHYDEACGRFDAEQAAAIGMRNE